MAAIMRIDSSAPELSKWYTVLEALTQGEAQL